MAQGSSMHNGMHEGSIAHHLQSMDFPASREELVAHVRQHSADGVAANLMELLPRGRYESPGEVMQALVTADERDYQEHVYEDIETGFAEDEEDDGEDDEDEDDGDDEMDDEDEDDEDDEDEDEDEDEDDEEDEDEEDEDWDEDDGEER